MDRAALLGFSRDELIALVEAQANQIAALIEAQVTARIVALEAGLAAPTKTPDNSRERGGLASHAGRPDRPRPVHAGVLPDHRRWIWVGPRAGGALAQCACPALHGSQAPQPAGARTGRPARGSHGRLQRHDLRRDRQRGAGQAWCLPADMASALSGCGHELGGSR